MTAWPELLGHQRADGGFGIRNHVLVVSTMDVTNGLARRIAGTVKGAVPITTSFGRVHPGAERSQHESTLAGLIRNPNTAAALVVGFEPETTAGVLEALGACGKPVEARSVLSDGSTTDLLTDGARIVADMVTKAGRDPRAPMPLPKLVLGLKCGGSDPTSGLIGNAAVGRVSDALVEAGATVILSETEDMIGAEHLLAARAASPVIGAEIQAAVDR
ncbi:MAG: UxaA family hydrolase, partial [Pseudomonadota bacterium]